MTRTPQPSPPSYSQGWPKRKPVLWRPHGMRSRHYVNSHARDMQEVSDWRWRSQD